MSVPTLLPEVQKEILVFIAPAKPLVIAADFFPGFPANAYAMGHEVFVQQPIEVVLARIFNVIPVSENPVVEISEADVGVCGHLPETNLDHRRREQIVAIESDEIVPSAMVETSVARGGRSTVFLVMDDGNPRRLPLFDVFEDSPALGVVAAVIDDDLPRGVGLSPDAGDGGLDECRRVVTGDNDRDKVGCGHLGLRGLR